MKKILFISPISIILSRTGQLNRCLLICDIAKKVDWSSEVINACSGF